MSGVVKCYDDECECLVKLLKKHGFGFVHDLWEPTFFTLFINNDALMIQAWHDAGSSTIIIPLRVLKDELSVELTQCGLLREVQCE